MKLKNIIFTTLLLFAFTIFLHAQEKYAYAAVTLSRAASNLPYILGISKEDSYEETKLNKNDFKSSYPFDDNSPLIKKINALAKEGWEVYNTTSVTGGGPYFNVTYYLKKKI